MAEFRIKTDNGKYESINNNGAISIYRNGELWDTGNKYILSLLYKIEDDQELIDKYERMLGIAK